MNDETCEGFWGDFLEEGLRRKWRLNGDSKRCEGEEGCQDVEKLR